jgi:hypothetical protein
VVVAGEEDRVHIRMEAPTHLPATREVQEEEGMEVDIRLLMSMRIILGLCRSRFGWIIIMAMEDWRRRCLRRLAICTIIISNTTIITSLEDSRARLRRLGVCCRASMVRPFFLQASLRSN